MSSSLCTIDEIAAEKRVSRRTVERWVKSRRFDVTRIGSDPCGRGVRIDRESFDAWWSARTMPATIERGHKRRRNRSNAE